MRNTARGLSRISWRITGAVLPSFAHRDHFERFFYVAAAAAGKNRSPRPGVHSPPGTVATEKTSHIFMDAARRSLLPPVQEVSSVS
jgi:hypothetical protein